MDYERGLRVSHKGNNIDYPPYHHRMVDSVALVAVLFFVAVARERKRPQIIEVACNALAVLTKPTKGVELAVAVAVLLSNPCLPSVTCSWRVREGTFVFRAVFSSTFFFFYHRRYSGGKWRTFSTIIQVLKTGKEE